MFSSWLVRVCCWLAGLAVAWPGLMLGQTNGVHREVYQGYPSGSLASLTNNSAFPSSPNLETVEPAFEAPPNWGYSYGQRLSALLIPPATGQYVFWIASDDQGALFISTDESPAHKYLIASVQGWTGSRQYYVEGNQQSAPITLTNGLRYYIEALMSQGGGGDDLAVAWQKPGDSVPNSGDAPIPGTYLIPYGLGPPVIGQQPTNTTGVEGGLATFTVTLQHNLGAAYQWTCNSTNLPIKTNATCTIGPLKLSDSNSVFQCFIANAYGSVTSTAATLQVLPDTTRPTLVSVVNLGDNQVLSVLFSEPLEAASANQRTNYTLNNGASVTGAVLSDDLRTVVLTTTPLSMTVNYKLVVSNVRDRAVTPNVILPNSQLNFNILYMPLDPSRLAEAVEILGPSSRCTPLVISELMYHPPARPDGRNLEFIELYNSQEWAADLSGFRISGDIDFTFPTNTSMAAKSFLVLAASPSDLQAVYGLTNVLGYDKHLNNSSGTVRLRNRQDAILLEAAYASDPPYPAAADGAGHSLVLARPSYGEGNPLAWSASDQIGGSPGSNDVATTNPQRTVMINELLANTDAPDLDYVELFNYFGVALNIGGCVLTDDPATNKYRFPASTTIPARGFLALDESQLGFALNSSGEAVYLISSNGTRVIDAVRFDGQAKNTAYGRYPDGSPSFHELSARTPGTNNAPPLARSVVINEVMYNPISGLADDEYVELYNRGSNSVSLANWHLRGGISFTFPADATLPTGGYLVVAHNAARLMTNYPQLNAANTLGNYSGTLGNNGDTVKLMMAEDEVRTNGLGALLTNRLYVAVDEVTYEAGGRWPGLAAGGGSSLELIDPRSDHRLAPNWAASDETAKSGWVTVENTGVLDNGVDTANAVHIILLGAGECLVDNVEVIPQGGANLVTNSTFASGAAGWAAQGTHSYSGIDETGGYGDNGRCLHIRATGNGDTGANRIRYDFASALASGSTATLRMKVRWLKGCPEILMRLRGNYLEATTNVLTAHNLGTPGLPNSRALANGPPAIVQVSHSPVLPTNSQSVVVTARIQDPDALSQATLYYRIDPATNYTAVALKYNGAGFFSATIPGAASGTLVAFYIEAKDNNTIRATATFPNDAPNRECLVRWGEPSPAGNVSLGVYRYWITQATVDRWSSREKLSNDPLDGTFAYNGRIIYNVGGVYSGSPWHAPGWSSPLGNACDYELAFPPDDQLMGNQQIKLLIPGNGGGDWSAQNETHAYWMASELGMPFNYTRYVHVFINGQQRNQASPVYVDSQQPNSDFMREWFSSSNGDLYKMVFWYEFDDAGLGFSSATGVSLGNFTTTGGVKKLARYRWNWLKRVVKDSASNYTNLFALVDAVNTSLTGSAYTTAIQSTVNVNEWARLFMLEKLVGNWDSYGNGGGQNMYGCKPEGDLWRMLIWDIDFAFSSGNGPVDMLSMSDGPLARIFSNPPFQRAYYQAMLQAVNGPLLSSRSNPLLDARYAALLANGLNATSPQGIKDYIAMRRTNMLAALANVTAPFAITSNNGADFSTNRNIISLSGTAPLEASTITVNGASYPITWLTVTNWTLSLALSAGTNALVVQGQDSTGTALNGATATVNVNFIGAAELPQDKLVINEIMYNPVLPNASFVEIFNTSSSNAYDMTGWRLDGVGFTFGPTLINPGGYAVVAKNQSVFAATYGASIPVAGEFPGNLAHDGEVLALVKPGLSPSQDLVINRVAYESVPPWPAAANGHGPSLQLIDPRQDNRRAANWAAAATNIYLPQGWHYYTARGYAYGSVLGLYLQTAGEVYLDDIKLVAGSVAESGTNLLSNGDFETAFPGPWQVSANLANSSASSVYKHGGSNSLHVVSSGGGSNQTTSIYQTITPPLVNGQTYTLIFWYQATGPGGLLTTRIYPSTLIATVNVTAPSLTNAVVSTPGAANNVSAVLSAFPPLWLNELQPANTTGLADQLGHHEPWVELFNSGTTNLNLGDFFLSDDLNNLANWAFPSNTVLAPRSFLLVWLDAQTNESSPAELHANFRAAPVAGALALSKMVNAKPMLLDYLNYSVPVPNETYGSFPDGEPIGRRRFSRVTPGATNDASPARLTVYINEWMADNTLTLADPADGQYEDWFELYNPTTNIADLAGCYLTDTLSNQFQFQIPAGYTIPAQGYLLVWADNETSQNQSNRADLHVNFKLSKQGEAIGLFSSDGTQIDAVTFGPQMTDVSQGRYPDGSSSMYFMSNSTPRAANILAIPNTPPILAPIPDQVITAGNLLSFTAVAVDTNVPAQRLIFSLGPGGPPDAYVEPRAGLFTWRPGPVVGPTTNLFTLSVTDDGVPALTASSLFQVVVIPLPRLSGVALSGGNVNLSWSVYPGKLYQVQYSEDLSSSVWINLGPPTPGTKYSLELTDPLDDVHQRFYRIIQ